MLVLTRKQDEEIKIGHDIVIRVTKIKHGSVRIGIEAPASVRVLRGEVATVEHFDFTLPAADFEVSFSEQLEECSLESLLVQN